MVQIEEIKDTSTPAENANNGTTQSPVSTTESPQTAQQPTVSNTESNKEEATEKTSSEEQDLANKAKWKEFFASKGNIATATLWNIVSTPFYLIGLALSACFVPLIAMGVTLYHLFTGNFRKAGADFVTAITHPLILIASALEPIRYQLVVCSYMFRDVKYSKGGLTDPDSIPSLDNYASSLFYNADLNTGKKVKTADNKEITAAPNKLNCNGTFDVISTYRDRACEKVFGLPDTFVNRFKKESNNSSQQKSM